MTPLTNSTASVKSLTRTGSSLALNFLVSATRHSASATLARAKKRLPSFSCCCRSLSSPLASSYLPARSVELVFGKVAQLGDYLVRSIAVFLRLPHPQHGELEFDVTFGDGRL